MRPSRRASLVAVAAFGLGLFGLTTAPDGEGFGFVAEAGAGDCLEGMISIRGKFCIDPYEAFVEEVSGPRRGKKLPRVVGFHSPFKSVAGLHVMARSERGRTPQGYISRDEAEEACINAGKRLCTDDEWLEACRGKRPTVFPYGEDHHEGYCNDAGLSSFNLLFGPGQNQPPEQAAYTSDNMNDARLNAMKGTVAKAGTFKKCKNSYGLYDMVGNLHEWTSAAQGTFRGGYYLDTSINGTGCDYKTTVHGAKYHDYSTGFRCCYGGAEQKRIEKLVKARSPAGKQPEGGAKTEASKSKKVAKKKPEQG